MVKWGYGIGGVGGTEIDHKYNFLESFSSILK